MDHFDCERYISIYTVLAETLERDWTSRSQSELRVPSIDRFFGMTIADQALIGCVHRSFEKSRDCYCERFRRE